MVQNGTQISTVQYLLHLDVKLKKFTIFLFLTVTQLQLKIQTIVGK